METSGQLHVLAALATRNVSLLHIRVFVSITDTLNMVKRKLAMILSETEPHPLPVCLLTEPELKRSKFNNLHKCQMDNFLDVVVRQRQPQS